MVIEELRLCPRVAYRLDGLMQQGEGAELVVRRRAGMLHRLVEEEERASGRSGGQRQQQGLMLRTAGGVSASLPWGWPSLFPWDGSASSLGLAHPY